jgi:phasin family protein
MSKKPNAAAPFRASVATRIGAKSAPFTATPAIAKPAPVAEPVAPKPIAVTPVAATTVIAKPAPAPAPIAPKPIAVMAVASTPVVAAPVAAAAVIAKPTPAPEPVAPNVVAVTPVVAAPVIAKLAPTPVTPTPATLAFSTLTQGMKTMINSNIDFAAIGKDNLEAFTTSSKIWTAGVQDLSKQFAASAKASLEESVAAFKALTTVKSVKEAIELQATYGKSAVAKALAESARLTEASKKLTEEALAPITARISVAVGSFSKGA